ncbi:glutathione peroxidase [bacterium]|nr:glutathione peroxidase [bacterium]
MVLFGLATGCVVTVLFLFLLRSRIFAAQSGPDAGIYSYSLNYIDGNPMPLSQFKGKVLMIVNVASRCGFTSQYQDLEELYKMYHSRGFVVIGVPANNFANQEPGSDSEIESFCKTTYGVTFPMAGKISVKGDDIHPLYLYLTKQTGNTSVRGSVKWNFNKFLIGKDGRVVDRFSSMESPNSQRVRSAVERVLSIRTSIGPVP